MYFYAAKYAFEEEKLFPKERNNYFRPFKIDNLEKRRRKEMAFAQDIK